MPQPFLIFTVGMNPLPVVVAAKRLGEKYQTNGIKPSTVALVSKESGPQYEEIKKLTKDFVNWKTTQCCENPYEPNMIVTEVNKIYARMEQGQPCHLHYSGGTKAMGVHGAQALTAAVQPGRLTMSYLEPSEHHMHYWGTSGPSEDERKNGWSLTVEQVAELHGYKELKGSDRKFPDSAVATAFCNPLRTAQARKEFSRWFQEFLDQFRNEEGQKWYGWDCPEKAYCAQGPVRWPPSASGDWEKATCELQTFFGNCVFSKTEGRWQLDVRKMKWKTFKDLFDFLNGFAFEDFVKKQIDPVASDYKLCHSFKANRVGDVRNCEIDLVFVLGYQLVAISCTIADQAFLVKHKAFEVWHRVRQLGGDGARAIVVCWMPKDRAEDLEKDVQEDLGTHEKVLEIWGADAIEGGLAERLKKYLWDNLKWEHKP